MTSATLTRNYRMVADAIIAATMPPLKQTGDKFLDKANAAIAESSANMFARHLERRHAQRRASIAAMTANPARFWNHSFWEGYRPESTATLVKQARASLPLLYRPSCRTGDTPLGISDRVLHYVAPCGMQLPLCQEAGPPQSSNQPDPCVSPRFPAGGFSLTRHS